MKTVLINSFQGIQQFVSIWTKYKFWLWSTWSLVLQPAQAKPKEINRQKLKGKGRGRERERKREIDYLAELSNQLIQNSQFSSTIQSRDISFQDCRKEKGQDLLLQVYYSKGWNNAVIKQLDYSAKSITDCIPDSWENCIIKSGPL
jgi:hypothetical protein